MAEQDKAKDAGEQSDALSDSAEDRGESSGGNMGYGGAGRLRDDADEGGTSGDKG